MGRLRWIKFAAITVVLLASASALFQIVLKPNLLWFTVAYVCRSDEVVFGRPAPCLRYSRQARVAVLPVWGSTTHLLLVPTQRIRGIEAPRLIRPDVEVWSDAWATRALLEARLGRRLPRDAIGLAVNSRLGRTQDQLHIHIDCVKPDVYRAVKLYEPWLSSTWSRLPFHLVHQTYFATKLYGPNLEGKNPLAVLARDPVAAHDMANETLAVLGSTSADGSPGFVLLSRHAGARSDYRGFAEELLDHHCTIAKQFN